MNDEASDVLRKFKGFFENKPDSFEHLYSQIEGNFFLCPVSQLNDPQELLNEAVKIQDSECTYTNIGSLSNLNNNNYKMWIHYANSFRGVCLSYRKKDLELALQLYRSENLSSTVRLQKVEYIREFVRGKDYGCNFNYKYFQWFEENEYRVICQEVRSYEEVKYLSIRPFEVAIGTGLSQDIQKKIRDLCIKHNIDFKTFHPNIAIWANSHEYERTKQLLLNIK